MAGTELLERLDVQLRASTLGGLVSSVAAYHVTLAGSHAPFLVRFGPARGVYAASEPPPASCRLWLGEEDWDALLGGRLSAQQLFFAGRLRIEGELTQALDLNLLQEVHR